MRSGRLGHLIPLILTLAVAACADDAPDASGVDVSHRSPDTTALDITPLVDVIADLAEDLPPDAEDDVVDTAGPSLAALVAALEAGDADGLDEQLDWYDGPVCESETCVVVTHLPEHSAVAIRGVFNAWEEEAMEASPLVGWFWAEIPASVVDGCMDYKLFADDIWFRDPLNRWIAFADIAINSALCLPGASRIALVEDVHSPQLDNQRSLYVYVPAAAFDDPTAAFPVLYMQDGFNVFVNPMAPFGSWEVDVAMDGLAGAGIVEPLIIVGVDTDNRMEEYLYAGIEVDLGGGLIQVTPRLPLYADHPPGCSAYG